MTTESEIQSELLVGERVIWTGQPLAHVIFHPSDWYGIPFSLMWGGFAIFWESGVMKVAPGESASSVSLPFVLWGIPFVLIGQYMIWGRFFYTAWKKKRTHYALTNKRVLVLNSGGTHKLVSAFLNALDSVTLTSRNDGIGTIQFAPEPERQSFWGSSRRSNRAPQLDIDLSSLAFFDIANVRDIYSQILLQQEAAKLREREQSPNDLPTF